MKHIVAWIKVIQKLRNKLRGFFSIERLRDHEVKLAVLRDESPTIEAAY